MGNALPDSLADWRDATEQIRRRVSVEELLRDERCKVRGRRRADCPFCKGSSRGTLSYRQEVWHCHRCARGGSVFDFVQAAHDWDFRRARDYLARLARVELPGSRKLSPEERKQLCREWAERKRREEQLDAACEELAEEERQMRIEWANYILLVDDLLGLPAPWTEEQWSFAAAISELRNENLLPTYMLLSFGAVGIRLEYLLASEVERAAIVCNVRWAGGVMAPDGHFVEMVTT